MSGAAEVHDYAAMAEGGALPLLNAKPAPPATPVLGAPTANLKSKSNVSKAVYVGIVVVALLFIVFGVMWYAKKRAAAAAAMPRPEQTAAKSKVAQKNQALESDSIEKTKAAIKEQQTREAAAKRSAEAASAAEAERVRAVAAETEKARAAHPATTTAAAAPAAAGASAPAAVPPKPPTPEDRRLSGDVLVALPAPKETSKEATKELATASATRGEGAGFGGLSGTSFAQGGRNESPANEGMAARLHPTTFDARYAGKLPNLDYLLKRGTTIPCALQTGIDTTLPGIVICKVLTDVYSANSATLLVERGATVFGEQQSALKPGQSRTFVLWTRIDNPSGVFANVDSPSSDQMGYSGIEGYVDTHFWERFGSAILLSVISDVGQMLTAAAQTSTQSNQGPTYNNTGEAVQTMAAEALRNSINIPPTLTVRPATIVNVMVARDVSFENVYSLVK